MIVKAIILVIPFSDKFVHFLSWIIEDFKQLNIYQGQCFAGFIYRVYPSNKQKQNWKIDTSLVAIGAQNLFFSLYKLGVNFLWIREILKMYISPSFCNRKKVQYYRFCIFKGVSKLDLLHSTGHKSLKNGSKSNKLGSLKNSGNSEQDRHWVF